MSWSPVETTALTRLRRVSCITVIYFATTKPIRG